MGWYGAGMGFSGWLFMGLLWAAVLTVIVWLVVRALPVRESPAVGGNDSPEDILDRRFARGEIDQEAYIAGRSTLTKARDLRR